MLMYMTDKVRVVSTRVSGEFYEALTRSAEEYGQTVSEFTKAALQAAITAPMNERRTLMRGASMVCALGEAAVLLRRVVREALAAGDHVTKVSAGLTGDFLTIGTRRRRMDPRSLRSRSRFVAKVKGLQRAIR